MRKRKTIVLHCDQCAAEFERLVSRFCSKACYYKSRQTAGAVRSTYHARQARELVYRHFNLKRGMIVHHKDHDETNGALSNLAVFESHAAHMRHHHGSNVSYLWDGADCPCVHCQDEHPERATKALL